MDISYTEFHPNLTKNVNRMDRNLFLPLPKLQAFNSPIFVELPDTRQYYLNMCVFSKTGEVSLHVNLSTQKNSK
jgi:hypothetical protein